MGAARVSCVVLIVGVTLIFPAGQVDARHSHNGRLVTRINKWFKVACIAEHLKETDHYICDKYGYVHCLPGWSDEMNECTKPVCVPECVPENGNCTRPNTCTCEVGWSGSDCSKCVCLPGCVNGDCRLPFECICREGWHGMLCNKPTCKEGCVHGSCSMPGECICQPGWTGENCDVCTTLPGCNEEHGYCDKPMECRCKPGWTGQFCSEPICRTGCHKDYGWCKVPDDCWCRAGWTGPNCDQCLKYPGCQNGACEQPWECNCAPGYTGMLCDVRSTDEPSIKPASGDGLLGEIDEAEGSLNGALAAARHRNRQNSPLNLLPQLNQEDFFGEDNDRFPRNDQEPTPAPTDPVTPLVPDLDGIRDFTKRQTEDESLPPTGGPFQKDEDYEETYPEETVDHPETATLASADPSLEGPPVYGDY